MKSYINFKKLMNIFTTIIFINLMLIHLMVFEESSNLCAATRGKISGTIIDAKIQEPLPGVNIIVVGTNMGTATDLSGDYFIANIHAGTYTLKISMMGYKIVTVKDVQVRVNRTTEVNLELEQVILKGEEVIVTAERPLVEKDNTSSTIILSKKEIVDQPTTEFTQVLTTLPSINVEDGELKFRGGTLDEVAFMVDGARARNPLDHSPYTNINLSSIQEVEVITGSFNAEYGEALSGVVNVITKEGSDNYQLFIDTRYTPPGKRHWGPALYDRSTSQYWENTHASYLEWWVENTDQWVDPNGVYGYDAHCIWTPEEAYENYLQTHQPLTDYTNTPSYQTEISFGGPFPFLNNLYFFTTAKYRSQAPLMGNSYRDKGKFFDGTLKMTYKITPNMKLTFSGFWGEEETSWGIDWLDTWYIPRFGTNSRYAYYDYAGLPETGTDGQTLMFCHVLSPNTLYELKFNRVHAKRKVWTFPDDPIGWSATEATRDNLRAVDSDGNYFLGGYMNSIGYHTMGYYYRYDDDNTEWNFDGFFGSQINKYWHLKTGYEFTYYDLDHFNQSKFPDRRDDKVYNPYQGALYFQNKLEFGGFIMNAGFRFDFYNPNDYVYSDDFNPLNSPKKKAKMFSQLSPRLGISHPIDERTVLHFSYGHFFQRPSFGDYGEGNEDYQQKGSLTTFVIDDTNFPWVLGNRNLKPQKIVAFEVGIERNFVNFFIVDVTGYYKDIRNTIRALTIQSLYGTYYTNSNGDYGDVRGVELSLRKIPSMSKYGALWGYINFTTQLGIEGSSGDPNVIRYDGTVQYPPSGDYILHNNPRLKAGLFYQTPYNLNFLAGLFKNITLSLDYQAVYPNEKLQQDYYEFKGKKYLRAADKNANLRLKKEITLLNDRMRISPYLEIHNVFNDKWISLETFEYLSEDEKEKFVDSNFDYLPSIDAAGSPILDLAKYRNLPRSIFFGATFEF
ncbi:MAG: TonB-dependent receptor [bacterium]|nr:MAG: TonB-dependent receptor [bacterium]